MTEATTVRGRIERAGSGVTATRAVGLGLAVALGAGLLVAQEPALHDAMHNFRHTAGVVCH